VRDRVGVKGVIMEFNMCCPALNFPLPQPPPARGGGEDFETISKNNNQ